MKLTLSAAAQAVSGRLQPPSAADITIEAAGIDTRRLPPQALFIALAGTHQDGHTYLPAAAQAGAAAAMVTRAQDCTLPQIIVADTTAALQQLAQCCRRQYRGRIAAITGSNGKTTVKEMLYSIAAAEMGESKLLRSPGNYNNHLGVPLTLLELNPLCQLAVIEAGMDHAGELTKLSALIQPQVAVINNAQRAHIGHFASVHDIACAKGELLSGLTADGCAVLNADDEYFPLWRELAAGRDIIAFGQSAQADLRGEFNADGIVLSGQAVRLSVAGAHNKMNALAAAAAAQALQLPMPAIVAGLTAYRGIAGRLTPHQLDDNILLIDDSYNANPDSAAAALDVLAETAAQKAAAALMIMGDMGALGRFAKAQHQALAEACAARQVRLFGTGEQMQAALAGGGRMQQYFSDRHALVKQVRQLALQEANLCILVKGSRSMRMEEISRAIIDVFSSAAQEGG